MIAVLTWWAAIALAAPAGSPPGPPLRRITDDLIAALTDGAITPPLSKKAPLECLGKPIHAPWANPYSPLPARLRERHVRMTLSPAKATVELRDAFLVEAPRTLAYDLVPLGSPRLELGYRLFSCGDGKGDVTLTVRATDATGTWERRVHLEADRPRRGEEAFRELAIDLPLAPGEPVHLELQLTPTRERGAGVLVALAEPVVTGVPDGPATAADTNVLWIVIDSVRADALGPGRPFEPSPTPNMDAHIFARGTGFGRAYSLSNQTRTSTMAMIASVPPSIGGFHSNSWAFTSGKRETFYAKDPPLITRELGKAGFRVMHFGNNHFLWNSEIVGLDNGFPRVVDFRGIPSDAVNASAAAIDLFTRRRDERWFLMLNYTAPHTPYKPPEALAERARETPFRAMPGRDWAIDLPRNYLGELMWVDDNLAPVFAKLDELGLTGRTLVIVTADHGEVMNPAHDCSSALVQLNCGFNHSVTVYDDELNVPLGIALPGRVVAGRTIDTPVSHADLPPTILDLLGLPTAPGQLGASLAGALAGGPVDERPIYADGRYASAVRWGDWKLIVHAPQDDIEPRARMIDGEAPRHELFDLRLDPLESRNLARARKDVVDTLLGELKLLRSDLRRRFEVRGPEPTAPSSSVAGVSSGGPIDARASIVAGDGDAKNHLMLVAVGAHHLSARVEAIDGAVRCPDAAGAAPGMRCASDGAAVVIDIAAAPGDREQVLDLVFTTTPARAGLRIAASLDGQPLPVDRLRLGPWGLCMLGPGGDLTTPAALALATVDTPRGASSAMPLWQPRETAVYFWRTQIDGVGPVAHDGVSPEDGIVDPHADEQLGGEVKKILKDLGYTH